VSGPKIVFKPKERTVSNTKLNKTSAITIKIKFLRKFQNLLGSCAGCAGFISIGELKWNNNFNFKKGIF
jgi:hypothetical protein